MTAADDDPLAHEIDGYRVRLRDPVFNSLRMALSLISAKRSNRLIGALGYTTLGDPEAALAALGPYLPRDAFEPIDDTTRPSIIFAINCAMNDRARSFIPPRP